MNIANILTITTYSCELVVGCVVFEFDYRTQISQASSLRRSINTSLIGFCRSEKNCIDLYRERKK